MEDLVQLRAKLDRTQANIEKGVGHLISQRARVAHRLAESEDVAQSRGLLATLEDTQFLHVQHRDRLRRKLDWALAGRAQFRLPSRDWPPCASRLIFRASAHCDQACCSARRMSAAGAAPRLS
jgi:hypothetical protein